MSLEKKNEKLQVLGPDIKKIPCAKCKWAVNGPLKSNCMKYAFKPYSVYIENKECPKFAPKKSLGKFSKGDKK